MPPVDDHAKGEEPRTDPPQLPGAVSDAEIETYETADGIVLYDAENPLAWLQSTAVVTLEDRR
ncbi:MAG: DUF7331 family protein [Halodesulfurarchaeum sp.]